MIGWVITKTNRSDHSWWQSILFFLLLIVQQAQWLKMVNRQFSAFWFISHHFVHSKGNNPKHNYGIVKSADAKELFPFLAKHILVCGSSLNLERSMKVQQTRFVWTCQPLLVSCAEKHMLTKTVVTAPHPHCFCNKTKRVFLDWANLGKKKRQIFSLADQYRQSEDSW